MSRGSPLEEFGPYLVYERLGSGGMAEVHRAEQAGNEGFRTVVALKRMLPQVATNDEMVASFVREARLASYLRHANVAQTYELGKIGDVYFIAMELIEGRSLRDVLRRCAGLKKVMPVRYTLNILNQICDALDYAHNLRDHDGTPLGIVHRDVSPSNVIVAENGVVKLIDFGIAKVQGAGMQTMSGTIKGKYGYMAPEYLGGRLDARADLFALGVIAHELLTGRPLFTTGDDLTTLQRLREMPIAPPSRSNPEVPREIDDIVMTALQRDPDRRWQQATALRTALTTLTKRLGMQVANQEVVQWLDVLDFESSTLPFGDKHADPPGDSVIISVEHQTIVGDARMPITVQLPGAAIDAPTIVPISTSAGTNGQSSNPPGVSSNAMYREAVRRYEEHETTEPRRQHEATVPRRLEEHEVTLPRRLEEPEATVPRRHQEQQATVRRRHEELPATGIYVARASAPALPQAAATILVAPPAAEQPHLTVMPAKPLVQAPSRWTAVLLVLLAAAVASIAVYFLLPT
ncbi:MAG: serine/threonine protein kinase [Deltaproteobacteria bacterium]|nr:serine/threonine protein kinase [Deltaproteobacteria bacterium]